MINIAVAHGMVVEKNNLNIFCLGNLGN